MRTKTVLLTAVLGAASIAALQAQTVYSVNAVGYVNVQVPAGAFALLANPLNQPTNSIPAVLPDVPTDTVVYVFNTTTGGFDQAQKRASGAWTGPAASATLAPGQGFFIKNGSAANPLNVTFVGEVPQGELKTDYPAGFSLLGSKVPQAGKLETDLGFKGNANDVVYTFNNGAYTSYTKRSSGSWTGPVAGEPQVGVAQGFFLKAAAAGSWTRTFSVNQ